MGTTIFGGVSETATIPQAFQNIPERIADFDEMMLRFADTINFNLRSCTLAQVVSFNPQQQTIVAQPLIQELIVDRDNGNKNWVTIAPINDVPVQYPQFGNFIITGTPVAGDTVLLVHPDSCIDSVWYSGGIQNWNDRRRHDLSDAVAICGFNPLPTTLYTLNNNAGIAPNAMEMRTKDGNCRISVQQVTTDNTTIYKIIVNANGYEMILDESAKNIQLTNGNDYFQIQNGVVNANASTTINLTAPTININGATNITNNDFSIINSAGTMERYNTHNHGYLSPVGDSNTTGALNPGLGGGTGIPA